MQLNDQQHLNAAVLLKCGVTSVKALYRAGTTLEEAERAFDGSMRKRVDNMRKAVRAGEQTYSHTPRQGGGREPNGMIKRK